MAATSHTDADGPRDPEWIRGQLGKTLNFWHTHGAAGRNGRYTSRLLRNGDPYDVDTGDLVASARFVIMFSIGVLTDSSHWCRDAAATALQQLADYRDPIHDGYFWRIHQLQPTDTRKHAYGHAFVLLAGAMASRANIPGARAVLDEAETCIDRFMDERGLAANTLSREWKQASSYRGQNANMHLCEAFLAAYEATGKTAHLNQAHSIATAMVRRIAVVAGGAVWENYHQDWSPDWRTEPADPTSVESRHGVVPGHQAEWAKLLGIMTRHRREPWMLERAAELYRLAWRLGWLQRSGGFASGVGNDQAITDATPSYWSPAEAIGAAAVLGSQTGRLTYWGDYDQLWTHARERLIDPYHGGWFIQPSTPEERTDFRKGDPFEPDYHAANACFEALRCLGEGSADIGHGRSFVSQQPRGGGGHNAR